MPSAGRGFFAVEVCTASTEKTVSLPGKILEAN
jgi:hypothetical protein